jgi:CRISPR-associated exonuclease Cas4
MFEEDDLLPLSGLQHLVFCERQCALIHIERVWRDNQLTVEGTHMHRRVHDTGPRRELRADLLVARGVPLRSLELGLIGKADIVEFHREATAPDGDERGKRLASVLPGVSGRWTAVPVEYKRGRPKPDHSDEVQLCAQAICLEEMLGIAIGEGRLYYGAVQRRHDVLLTKELRQETRTAAARLHELLRSGITPRARRAPKCRRCSLIAVCRPDGTGPGRSASRYVAEAIRRAIKEGDDA